MNGRTSRSDVAGWLLLAGGAAAALVLLLPRLAAAFAILAAIVVAGLYLHRRWEAAQEAEPAEPSPPPPPPREQIVALLDLFAEGVLLLDEDRLVIAANESAARILGRPRQAMTGVSLIRAARDHVFVEVLREAAARPREVMLGDQKVIYATAAPVNSGEIRMVLTLQDITALRRAERARQDLVANVSHELRTPIAAALALAETLESGVEEPEQRERFLRQLTSELERLSRIVDRLLRLSRIESEIEEFQIESVQVGDLLEESRRRIGPVAERREVALVCEVAPGTPPVRADRERVLEVMANLLDNAIRHSPERGTVTLRAGPHDGRVRIDVQDQGPGILPQDRLRIFERFYTADRSRGDWRGTGLGLAIARHIVSRHGGEIWVADSAPGATLSFTLPRAEEASEATPDAAQEVPRDHSSDASRGGVEPDGQSEARRLGA